MDMGPYAAGSLSHQRLPSAANGLNFGHGPNPVDNNTLIYPILWLFNTHMENDPSIYIYTYICFMMLCRRYRPNCLPEVCPLALKVGIL